MNQITAARDRILAGSLAALSDGELLAALDAAPLAGEEIAILAWQTPAELTARGIKPRHAASVAAAFELGRRGAWSPPKKGAPILQPDRVAELMRPIAHADREEFHAILLDVRGRLIRSECVAVGSLSQCPVDPRAVFRPAIRENAHGIIFVHNHPSGDPSPSSQDADLTDRLRAAAEIVGVMARDHVIVAAGGYFSFVEAGRWSRR